MSKWIPPVGVICYIESTRVIHENMIDGYTPVVIKRTDRSFTDTIFRVLAKDDRTIILHPVWSQYSSITKDMLLVMRDWAFYPVGPDISRHLGIEQNIS